MQRILAIPALLLLAACAPLDLEIPGMERAASSSSSVASSEPETATGDLTVTPEPFAEPTEPVVSTGAVVEVEESMAAGTLILGDGDAAPLSITVFLHPSSPYSRDFQRQRMPMLLEEFVRRGKLAIQLATLPIEKYPGADGVVKTISCAAGQGRGHAAHARLFDNATTALAETDFADLELDPATFDACMSAMDGDVLASTRALAEQWGVALVPTYVIRGETFVGLPTEADLRGQINAAL